MITLNKHTAWPINVVSYNLMHLKPHRDKDLWVFGAWMGQKYDDNARFLFEYVNKNHSDSIKAVWLTDNEDVVKQMRALGYQAYLNKSREGKYMQLKAGCVLYTHGLDDFGNFPLTAGALTVSLWHGMPLKKIYNEKYSGSQLKIKKLMDRFFCWQYRDITVITSEYVRQLFKRTFNLKDNAKYAIVGQPRNDALFGLDKKEVLKNAPVDCSKQIVLYMPTYRMKTMGEDAIKNIVEIMYNSDELNRALEATNSVLIVKPHPVTPKLSLKNRDNFVVLNNNEVESNQKLLGIADMLITDYSSCSIDYALLGRPVVFYVPDEKEYIEKSEPIYDIYFEISKHNRCETVIELSAAIEHPTIDGTNALNDVYNDPITRDANNCKRVYECIVKELGIKQE